MSPQKFISKERHIIILISSGFHNQNMISTIINCREKIRKLSFIFFSQIATMGDVKNLEISEIEMMKNAKTLL